MADEPIKYSVREGDDGRWKIETVQLRGTVFNHGTLPDTYASQGEAEAAIEQIIGGQGDDA